MNFARCLRSSRQVKVVFWPLCVIYALVVLNLRLFSSTMGDNDAIFSTEDTEAQTNTLVIEYSDEGRNSNGDYTLISKDQLNTNDCGNIGNSRTRRYSDWSSPTSGAISFANCDLPNAKCKYFYPANFFDKECGIGKKYTHFVVEMEEKRLNATLWKFMPKVGFPTLSMKHSCLTSEGEHHSGEKDSSIDTVEFHKLKNIGLHIEEGGIRCMTERLSFLHVHKSGGSSLHNAFNYMGQLSKSASIKRHQFFLPYSKPSEVTDNVKIREDALRALTHATKYPVKEFSPEQHVIFALVRDPTERFISSIGQAMGASGSFKNHLASSLKEKCLKSTSSATLQCVAKYVKKHSFWIELHFTPQVMDISFATLYQDVPVSILPFSEIKTVLEYFGRGKVWDRDGSAENYRADAILTNMTVEHYDEETLRIVCEMYEMDVIMQRSLGIRVPRCDPYVPELYNFVN